MDLTKNLVALQKDLVVPEDRGMDNRIPVATLQSHLMQLGYMLDEDAFFGLSKSDLPFIIKFSEEVIPYLKGITGGARNFKPLYKNFPEEVMSLINFELFCNALFHYWSNGTWEPSTHEYERPIKFESIKYKMLRLGTQAEFAKIFTDLVAANTSLTENDKKIIEWFVRSEESLVLPGSVPFKETLCLLAGLGVENLPVKTPTDVLRIAVYLSGGDISLPKVPKKEMRVNRRASLKVENPARIKFRFKKFSRRERKYLLGLLEKTHCDPREMVLRDQRWIRLGEILHPSEYKSLFPKVSEAFHKIRNEKVKSWYGILDEAFSESLEKGLETLSQRPGEFSRRIDWLVRKNPENLGSILSHLDVVLQKTSNKVLFETYRHFETRRNPSDRRSIILKGARKKINLPSLPSLSENIVELIHRSLFSTLRDKFSTLPPLGNCWLDEALKKIPLPSNMRSMSFSAKPVIRGQRIPFDTGSAKVIRPFVHWMDEDGSVDLDLSVTFVGQGKTEVLAFTQLKVGNSVHSGDVRHRKGPCAEYVDIDIEDAKEMGYRYAVLDVRNFDGGSLNSVECMFGIMEREHPEANPIWLPETISNCQALQSESSVTLVAILDLETREYVALDVDSSGKTFAAGDSKYTLEVIRQYVDPPKVSVYDLLLLHVEARGRQVTLDQNVDTYFKAEDFIHSYEETAKWMGI